MGRQYTRPIEQRAGDDSDVPDGGHDHANRYEAFKTKVRQNKPKCGSGEIRTRSGCIYHEPEGLGINQIYIYDICYLPVWQVLPAPILKEKG